VKLNKLPLKRLICNVKRMDKTPYNKLLCLKGTRGLQKEDVEDEEWPGLPVTMK
jgi:hypothetical protein